MKKKKVVIIIIIALILILGAGAVYFVINHKKTANEELVYVESVANITGTGLTGDNRYMGVVESQESKGVDKASDKTVKEIFVEVGDEVKEGDPLFEYDLDEMNLKLKQLELELSSINNNIATLNQQIATLAAERDQVGPDYKMEYTAQIQSLQAQVNQGNYDASSKQLEIDRQKASLENSTVYAPMDGIIKEINKDADGTDGSDMDYGYDSGSQQKSFISIMALGDYRIKATASELNVRSMSEGQAIIVRSRMDENVTWTGTISSIDLEHPVENNNDYYSDSSNQTSKYPFYITLDSIDGLMLGQHVYVELDYGQGASKEGLWLDEYYIMQDEGAYYVWAEDRDGRIEKRKIEVGEYDEEMYRYEIVSGLTTEDYIAWPEERIQEGMKATHNYEDIIPDDEGMIDDGSDMMLPDGYSFDEDGNLIDENGNIVDDASMLDGEDGMIYEDDGMMYEDDGDVILEDGVFEDGMGGELIPKDEVSDGEEAAE